MNASTNEIARILKVSLQDALRVQDYIDNNWLLDWSECSKAKFNSVVRQVWAKLSNA
jgi:hypothetical protein